LKLPAGSWAISAKGTVRDHGAFCDIRDGSTGEIGDEVGAGPFDPNIVVVPFSLFAVMTLDHDERVIVDCRNSSAAQATIDDFSLMAIEVTKIA
jgi:hypothetical protein